MRKLWSPRSSICQAPLPGQLAGGCSFGLLFWSLFVLCPTLLMIAVDMWQCQATESPFPLPLPGHKSRLHFLASRELGCGHVFGLWQMECRGKWCGPSPGLPLGTCPVLSLFLFISQLNAGDTREDSKMEEACIPPRSVYWKHTDYVKGKQ